MLPFLVVHGPVVWKVALVVIVLVAVLAVHASVRRRERRRVLEFLGLRDAPLSELRAGPATVRGVFRGNARSAIARDGTVVDEIEGEAWLSLENGGRIDLDGPMRVVVGSRARVSPIGRRTRVDQVRDGDVVTVRGLLGYEASVEDAGYRDSAGRWTMRPDPASGEPLTVAAAKPAVRARAMGPALLATVVIAGGAGYATFQLISLHPEFHSTVGRSTDAAKAFPEVGIVSLAAVFPRSRELALDEIDKALENELDRSETRDAMRDQLDDLRSTRCEDTKKALHRLEDGRFEAAVEAAHRCPVDTRIARSALLQLAHYDEALALGAPEMQDAGDALVAALATWNPARAELAQRAAAWSAGAAKEPFLCLASWLAQSPLPDDCAPEAEEPSALDEYAQSIELVTGPPSFAWLIQFVSPATVDDPRRMHMIAVEIVRGDFEAARREAALLRDPALVREATRAIAARSGTPARDEPMALYGDTESHECPFADAISQAWRSRDGAPIAAVVRRTHCYIEVQLWAMWNLFEVIPNLSKGQAELAEALRTHPRLALEYPFVGITPNVLPAERAANASMRRDLARLLGDREEEKRQAAIVQRAIVALSTREQVLAFRQLDLVINASRGATEGPAR